MNMLRCSFGIALCGSLMACGGAQKPAVEPAPEPAPVEVQKLSLDSAVDRYSYALGMDLGKAIANINVPVKLDVVMTAIQDEVDPARPVLMTDSASESALQDLLLQMQKQKEADEKAAAEKYLQDQVNFLAKNILDSTVKTTPKGVQYRVIKVGTGISPKVTDKVKVHYIGALLDGTQFDNSVARGEPLEFPVSAVIEGWQDLLQAMKEGDKVKAWIPSALAYGEAGVPPMIPGNSLLIFEVELLNVFAETPALDSMAILTDSSAVLTDSTAKVAPADTVKADSVKAAPKADAVKAEATKAKPAPATKEAAPAVKTEPAPAAKSAPKAEPVKAEAPKVDSAKTAATPKAESAPAAKPATQKAEPTPAAKTAPAAKK